MTETLDPVPALRNRLLGDTLILLEQAGDKPLTQEAIRTLALALVADRLCHIASIVDHVRDGDCLAVAAWDMGKP